MGPNIEPCGIPDKSMWKALSVSLIFAPCFPRFKHECTKVNASSDKSYAWSFTASKSWSHLGEIHKNSTHEVFVVSDFFQVFCKL